MISLLSNATGFDVRGNSMTVVTCISMLLWNAPAKAECRLVFLC